MKEAMVREAKRRILSLAHFGEYLLQKKHIEGLLDIYDPSPVNNQKPQKCESIAFMITRMVRFHGGQTSVLRVGSELAKRGMKVYYLVYKKQSIEEMKKCAASNLPGYKGRCLTLASYERRIEKGKLKKPDFVCASSWDTVSVIKRFADAYKLYFVQDYEPYFYRYGEEFLMCRSTYHQGLHMISLGSWNRDMIENEPDGMQITEKAGKGACGTQNSAVDVLRIDTIDFPYEPGEYSGPARDYNGYAAKKKLAVAAYVKFYGKRLPGLIPYMLNNTARKLKQEGIELEILYFGEAKSFKAAGGSNLGQLTRNELNELYAKADFGIVASMSNISLVPFEMHAAGLPVIEFADGTYTHFLPADSAILTDISKTDIAAEILEAVRTPGKLEDMHNSAMKAMEGLSWEKTGGQFYRILTSIVG